MATLEQARIAARQFGGEAEANKLPGFSKNDRDDIAFHYGVEKWSDIPTEDQTKLLLEYRYGERAERAKTFGERLYVEITKDWTPADWRGVLPQKLQQDIQGFLDGNSDLYGNLAKAVLAFERHMQENDSPTAGPGR